MLSIDEARPFYAGAEPAHDFDHVLRVLTLALRLARAEGADPQIVQTAALLHDIARHAESETGEDHALAAARRARAILAERNAPGPFIEAVAAAIANHRFRTGAPPAGLEAQILYDADKLDAIGCVGVARAYLVGGRTGQRLWSAVPEDDALDAANPTIAPPDHTPVREYMVKLRRLRDTLHTAEARRIAAGRHDAMVAFFSRLAAEVQGEA